MTADDLAELITARADEHEGWGIRAAAHLTTQSILLWKIGRWVDDDGWIQWEDLAAHLTAGTWWSSSEVRLAKLGCSLSGLLRYVPDSVRAEADIADWSLYECTYGLDRTNTTAVLEAARIALTGQPG